MNVRSIQYREIEKLFLCTVCFLFYCGVDNREIGESWCKNMANRSVAARKTQIRPVKT